MVLKQNTGGEPRGKTKGRSRTQGRKSISDDGNAARSNGRRVAMANHWPPEITALIVHAACRKEPCRKEHAVK
jgi:hypothetical protein